ncbi:MAG: bifunctional 4-hydroxy-2-oxoglutarate aldolase/2-dehydro-3-deoxy-phosphogluconate aldolase [Clostridiales bacterium]|nr:bifunctional 4-hydroxy-2-oxoglutarate aldolase/2-dehydro-3-deoxy-phosphogluconate aldolase [Clostridiales bacterium]
MDILAKMARAGIVPVVVIEHAEDAVPAAQALLAGGIDVMEITFRTAAAPDAIKAVSEHCPEMTVGAGTVITLEQCKKAVELGARFIVAPGFDEEVVRWCVDSGIAVTPGCITPTEIMQAKKLGLHVVKFFPANVYGGLSAMKALSGPFGDMKFIPTGGISADNISEYGLAPYVHAVGGSWLCAKKDITEHNFDRITELSREARTKMLDFAVDHVGINCADADTSMALCRELENAFGFSVKEGNSSNFSSSAIEVMKSPYLGQSGHISVSTNRMEMAIGVLKEKGYKLRDETAKYKGDRMTAVYLAHDFGGFAVHLKQR